MIAGQGLPAGENSPAFLELPVNNDRESIIRNIQHNVRLGLPELKQHDWRQRPCMVVAGGPSLKDYLPIIRAYSADCDVLAINGAYKYLRENGIECDHFVLIDSRAENVTHVEGAAYTTNHCVASQVHPLVLDSLMGKPVTMFHLGTQTARDALPGQFTFLTAPIGMASVHAVYVAAALGYKTQILFGYDFSQTEDSYAFPQPMNAGDKLLEVTLDGRTFKTTFAMARTAELLVRAISPVMIACELDVRLYADGLLSAMLAKAYSTDPVEKSEKEKYEGIWRVENYSSCSPALLYVEDAVRYLGMKPGESVADFGCGTGRSTRWFVDHGYPAVGVDLASNCLKEEVPFVEAALWDAEKLPKVDWGFSCDVLEHIPQPKVLDTLNAIHDSCAKGAYLNIDTIHDSFGVLIGQQLHMTVMDGDEWLKVLETIWEEVDYYPGERQAVFVCRR